MTKPEFSLTLNELRKFQINLFETGLLKIQCLYLYIALDRNMAITMV